MKKTPQINPGILNTVKTLRSWGFNTQDSGDGQTHDYDCDLSIPYVHIMIQDPSCLWEEMVRLRGLLGVAGVCLGVGKNTGSIPTMEGSILSDGSAWIHLFNVVIL